jgi:hypothetical protein
MNTTNVFAQLPEDLYKHLTVTSGVVLGAFDPTGELDRETVKSNILFATDGGVNPVFTYTYKDLAEGIDNCPTNTMELMRVDSVSAVMSGTAKTITTETLPRFLAHADVSGVDIVEITPRKIIEMSDFKSYWHVCPYGVDGFIAIHLKNALNTGGFNWQTVNNDKGSFPFTFTGFSSLENPDEIPFKIYVKESSSADVTEVIPTTD